MKQFFRILIYTFLISSLDLVAQPVPSVDEKIPFICTFSKQADKNWGDDDFVQTFFFIVPESYKKPVYIRVFDPDCGGMYDENHNDFNSKTKFSVYGGSKAHSDPDAIRPDPVGNFKSGILLASKIYGDDKSVDNKWVTLGPFNPIEGELQKELGGRVFKVIIEGMEGDDGNLYRLFLSSVADDNKPIEGGNGFAYEYAFRLFDAKGSVSHLYPFVADKVTAVKIKVFDYDNEGMIRIISVAKKGDACKLNEEGLWIESMHRVVKEEINTSLDIQFIKQSAVKNNNIVVYIANQYGELMPFFTTPIGGVPKYLYKIAVKEE
ncbi:hypothetical protein CNR22_23460 [Sphingobacteriaceae bacterium]|nr:hypothetical protein CNR22_23460 [Sphingobacteriaceae bacterium]